MKPRPGYRRVSRTLAMTWEFQSSIPPEEWRKQLAYETGDLLAETLLTGEVDTAMPIYIDGAQKTPDPAVFMDLHEVRVQLDYMPREQPFEKELEAVRHALSQATGLPPERIHYDRHPLDMD
jgi:hypothetical protein